MHDVETDSESDSDEDVNDKASMAVKKPEAPNGPNGNKQANGEGRNPLEELTRNQLNAPNKTDRPPAGPSKHTTAKATQWESGLSAAGN